MRKLACLALALALVSCAEMPVAKYQFGHEHDDFEKQDYFVLDTQPLTQEKANDDVIMTGFKIRKTLAPGSGHSFILVYEGYRSLGVPKDESMTALVDDVKFYALRGRPHSEVVGALRNRYVHSEVPFPLDAKLIQALKSAHTVRLRFPGASFDLDLSIPKAALDNMARFFAEANTTP